MQSVLLKREASERGISEADLIKIEITDKALTTGSAGDIPNVTGLNVETLKDREALFFQELSKQYHVQYYLEPPRLMTALPPGAPTRGGGSAPITIIEFSDFECPYCRQMQLTLDNIQAQFPGKIQLQFRHFPLSSHSFAKDAATFAVCGHLQGKFWEANKLLFQTSPLFGLSAFQQYGAEIGLDPEKLASCTQQESGGATWGIDRKLGQKLGVSGTPTLFINGMMVAGVIPQGELVRIITAELQRQSLKKQE